jgi:glycosyltransferase involved in cell wall biosynthesis
MRLLIASDQWSPDVVGGSARVAGDTARLLASRGHAVTVLAPRIAGLPEAETTDDVELRRVIRRSALPQTLTDPWETWRARDCVRAVGADVLLAHQSTVAAGLLAARIAAPLVLVFHASVTLEQRFLRRHLGPARRAANLAIAPAFVALERLALARASRILVLSEYSRRLVLEARPDAAARVVLVRGGIDGARFRPEPPGSEDLRSRWQIPAGRPFLLTVRRLEPRMGLEELLRGCRLLLDRGRTFTLGVAGAGMLAQQLRSLAGRLELEGHVRFFGRVPEDDLPAMYGAADLFVLPTVAYEGFGMSTIEALGCGTPVVGTPVGATPELLRPIAPSLIAASASPEDLAAAIERGLAAGDLRERCAAYAHERYDWDRAIDDWEQALTARD